MAPDLSADVPRPADGSAGSGGPAGVGGVGGVGGAAGVARPGGAPAATSRPGGAPAATSRPARVPDEVTPFGRPGTPGDPILRWATSASTVEGIQRELVHIWAQPQALAAVVDAPERTVAARSSVLNFVVVCRNRELGERAAADISMLTGRHPSRTMILVPADPDGPGWIRAAVKAYCMVPRTDAPETCAEQIEVLAGGETGRHLGSIVAPLLVHDLPVALWWPGDPPFGSRLAAELLGMADRLVVDGSGWSGDGLERLRYVAAASGPTLIVADFALMRQARWREAVASVFDLAEFTPYLRHLRRVSVTYGTRGGPDAEERTNIVKPVYQVAWLASRLGLRVRRPLARVERPGRAAARKVVAPGAGPDPGRGMRAVLGSPLGGEVEVVIRPVISEMPAGTTLRVEILAERRGAELRAEVTAETEWVHVRVWEDGVEELDRAYLAPRRTEVDLLAEAIEASGRDRVAEQALAFAARLVATGPAEEAAADAGPTGDLANPRPAGTSGAGGDDAGAGEAAGPDDLEHASTSQVLGGEDAP